MRKTDSAQVIELLKAEVDQLRIQNELDAERNQIQLETISQRNEELRLVRYSIKQKDEQMIRKDEELMLLAEQNKLLAGYVNQTISLNEQAEKILDNQKQVNKVVIHSKAMSANALSYAMFLTRMLDSIQPLLVTKMELSGNFMKIDLEEVQKTEKQMKNDYAEAIQELKALS